MEAGNSNPNGPQGPGVDNVDTPPDPGLDPAARDEAGDREAEGATPTSQDVPAEEVEQTPIPGDAANQVHSDAPPPADWQSGEPNPGDTEQDRAPTQTAGGSTDGLSPGTQSDDNVEGDGSDD